jgi:hypothetical protein
MTSDIQSLLSRLKASTEGSRELDMDIRCAIGLPDTFCYHKVVCWHRKADGWWDCETDDGFLHFEAADTPHYTTLVDAALSLVPEGWTWVVSWQGGKPWAAVGEGEGEPWREWSPDHAATPAIALVVAALRARGA